MKIIPMNDYVLVKSNRPAPKKENNLYLPEQGVKLDKWINTVLATGKDVPDTIKAGDKILFNVFGARVIKQEDRDTALLLVKYEDIYGRIEE